MARIHKTTAADILKNSKAWPPGDYHALSNDSVESLASYAREFAWRAPKLSNGSKTRAFHSYLLRIVARRES